MAATDAYYTGDGATTDYAISWDYLAESHVKVTVDEVETTAFSFVSTYLIRFDSAPASDAAIRIYRDTPTTPLVDFENGSVLLDSDLDTSYLQSLYFSEEQYNYATYDSSQYATAAEASATDAETAQTAAETAQTAAEAAQSAAETAQTSAETAQTAAEAAQSAAETAQTGAETAEANAEAAAAKVPDIEAGDARKVAVVNDAEDAAAFRSLNYIRGDHKITPYDATSNVIDEDDDHSSTDAKAAIQEIIDTAEADWYSAHSLFRTKVDLAGRGWTVGDGTDTTGLDFANIRNPGFSFGNGGLAFKMASGVAMDCPGVNSPILHDLNIYGTNAYSPDVGLLVTKADADGMAPWAFPDAKQWSMRNVWVRGYFRRAAGIGFASEVMNQRQVRYVNNHRDTRAMALAIVSGAASLNDYLGTGLASDPFGSDITSAFGEIAEESDGTQSNILHTLGQFQALRQADVNLTLTSVTKGNPTVLNFDSSDLTAAGLTNGDSIFVRLSTGHADFISALDMQNFTISNLDEGAGTLTVAVDSTSFGTSSEAGTVYNTTGPALLLNGLGGLSVDTGYLLTYGAPGVIWDVSQGGQNRHLRLKFQGEADMPEAIRFDTGSANAILQDVVIELPSINQEYGEHVIGVTGTGSVEFDGGGIKVSSMGTVPSGKLFEDTSKVCLRGPDIELAKEDLWQSPYTNTYKQKGSLPAVIAQVKTADGGYPKQYGWPTELRYHTAEDGSTHTGTTTETVLKSIDMPAYYPGVNGRVIVRGKASLTGTLNAGKTFRVRLNGVAGTVVSSTTVSSTARTAEFVAIIDTRDAINQQLSGPTAFIGLGSTTQSVVTSSQTFASAWTIDVTCALTDAADEAVLNSVSVTVERYNEVN